MNSIKNRNQSFREIREQLPAKRRMVLNAIKHSPGITAWNLAERMGVPINEVTGRIRELKDAFLIEEAGEALNLYTYRNNTTYRAVANGARRIELINAEYVRLRDLRDQLVSDYQKGLSNAGFLLVKRAKTKIERKIKKLDELM